MSVGLTCFVVLSCLMNTHGMHTLTCAGLSHFLRKSSLALARNSLTVEDKYTTVYERKVNVMRKPGKKWIYISLIPSHIHF